jgi:hypothetical protein
MIFGSSNCCWLPLLNKTIFSSNIARLVGSTISLSDLGMISWIRNRKDVSRFLDNPDEYQK